MRIKRFLRSEQSLIQAIGRAARNLQGKSILYADKITGSMQRAIDETQRRRSLQMAHNQKYGVTPKSINKAVADIMEGAYAAPQSKRGRKVAEDAAAYDIRQGQPIENIAKEIKRLKIRCISMRAILNLKRQRRLGICWVR